MFLLLSYIPYPPPTATFCFVPGGDLQASCGTLDEGGVDDSVDWEEEREMERVACEGEDFIPPKIMVSPPVRNVSSKPSGGFF